MTNRQEFQIVDSRIVSLPDSFVYNINKVGSGSGEAKLYIGNESDDLDNFWGDLEEPIKCMVTKLNLLHVLEETASEYFRPSQEYQKTTSERSSAWYFLKEEISLLPEDDFLYFESYKVDVKPPRRYIKSDSDLFKYIRKIGIAEFTDVQIYKLRNQNRETIYYFEMRLKNQDRISDNDFILATDTDDEETDSLYGSISESELSYPEAGYDVLQKTKVRKGQAKFREKLLDDCGFCPFTLVNEKSLLVASHIKPWAVSSEKEKVDVKNGLMFTPTYDKLFDLGLISFTSKKELLVSSHLSKDTIKKLGIQEGQVVKDLPLDDRRNIYLEHHRNYVFKK